MLRTVSGVAPAGVAGDEELQPRVHDIVALPRVAHLAVNTVPLELLSERELLVGQQRRIRRRREVHRSMLRTQRVQLRLIQHNTAQSNTMRT